MTLHRATEPIVVIVILRMFPVEVDLAVVRIPVRVRNVRFLTELIRLAPRSRPRCFFRILNSAQT